MNATGWRLEIHAELGSTSDEAIRRAEAGEGAGLAVLARRQTRARGSRGRVWVEPPAGNLALSVLLRPEGGASTGREAVFRAALALHAALAPHAGDATLQLKWPNDVLLGGGKLAGILVESAAAGDRLAWLVIGFGANLRARPALEAAVPTACLADAGAAVAPETVARGVLAGLDRWMEAPFAEVREAWLARAQPPGTKLLVDGVPGRFEGLGADGALLFAADGGARHEVSTARVLACDIGMTVRSSHLPR